MSGFRSLRDDEIEVDCRPYLEPGESGHPTPTWPRRSPSRENTSVSRTLSRTTRWFAGGELPRHSPAPTLARY